MYDMWCIIYFSNEVYDINGHARTEHSLIAS